MTRRTLKILMRIKGHTITLAVTVVLLLIVVAHPVSAARDEAEVRGVVERIFQQLKTGDYDALYETLPTAQQRRITR